MKYLLFPLLALIIALGMLVIKNVEADIEEQPYEEVDLFIQVIANPVFTKEIRETDYYTLIKKYDWNASTMYKIMLCESSGNANAHNFNHRTKDSSVGLFQINLYGNLANTRPSKEWLLIPKNNISYAYEIWMSQGYLAWRNCYRKVR